MHLDERNASPAVEARITGGLTPLGRLFSTTLRPFPPYNLPSESHPRGPPAGAPHVAAEFTAHHAADRPGRALPRRPPADGTAVRSARAGRLPSAVHAGCQPREMASRPYDLVLRDVRAGATAQLSPFPSSLRLSLQFVLRVARRSLGAPAARLAVA